MKVTVCSPSVVFVLSNHLFQSCFPRNTSVSSRRNCSLTFRARSFPVWSSPSSGVRRSATRSMKVCMSGSRAGGVGFLLASISSVSCIMGPSRFLARKKFCQ